MKMLYSRFIVMHSVRFVEESEGERDIVIHEINSQATAGIFRL